MLPSLAGFMLVAVISRMIYLKSTPVVYAWWSQLYKFKQVREELSMNAWINVEGVFA
jgi:hypothetical protein